MKPYYNHGGIQIYHGNCLEVIESLAIKCVGGLSRERGIVVADRDEESRTGENAARQTGLRYWLPPDPG